jgi:hypothetical protein
MEVMIMNQNESDQIWQQLRFHMENFFSPTLANDVPEIDYKPSFIALLEIQSEHFQNDQ